MDFFPSRDPTPWVDISCVVKVPLCVGLPKAPAALWGWSAAGTPWQHGPSARVWCPVGHGRKTGYGSTPLSGGEV